VVSETYSRFNEPWIARSGIDRSTSEYPAHVAIVRQRSNETYTLPVFLLGKTVAIITDDMLPNRNRPIPINNIAELNIDLLPSSERDP